MTRKESGAGLRRAESPDGEGELTRNSYLAEENEDEQVSRGLNHLVSRSAAGTQWTCKKVTLVVDSGAAENVMLRSMLPEIGIRQTERSKNGKGFKGPGGENIKNCGQQIMSVRNPEGVVRKSTWQVADVRRPLVSASHIIQAGSDLFIGKDEAYIMNSKKASERHGNVCVLDLFVRVPSSVAAPIVCTPTEVDAINQVADGREPRRRVTFDCNSPTS